MKIGAVCDGLKPVTMMVAVQVALTGVNILYKLAGSNGFSLPVLIAYRFLFAAVTVIPLALIFERKKRPKLSWKIVLQAFGCALFGGSLAQNLYAESLVLTSATFAAAIANLIPALTFILAIIFRMEELGLKTIAGKAKLMGTILSLGGAMILTFYKGIQINILSTHYDLLHKTSGVHVAEAHDSRANILGLLLALGCCFSVSLSLIGQAKMSAAYPCHYSSTALISIMGSIQAVVFALCAERDWKQWKLGWNLKLLTVVYMGIFATGIMWIFIMSCGRTRGPLFVSAFNPLLLVFVALAGTLLLNEKLHLGSVVGAAVIICGLYLVLWGKSREVKKVSSLLPSKSFKDETTIERFKDFDRIHDVVVTPDFVSEFHDDEDLEANVST